MQSIILINLDLRQEFYEYEYQGYHETLFIYCKSKCQRFLLEILLLSQQFDLTKVHIKEFFGIAWNASVQN